MDAYLRADRDMRAAMVGKVRSQKMIHLLYHHDTKPKPKGKKT